MQIGGWFGVFVAAIAYYIAFAELTNECYRKASSHPPLSLWMRGRELATSLSCEDVFGKGLPHQAFCP